jgi:pimeloyl-ACP methyl ester carboxylesterase
MSIGITRVSAVCALAALCAAGAPGQETSTPYRDPTKHTVQFVTVDKDVRLEIVDWGGSGQALVLLSGSGHTAHVYDDFAPKLTDCCHVYGITRRGFGASTRPPSGYDDQRLADDVFAALNEARIASPVLVGHSMAGGEMTTLGRNHPDRVAGLVYLDALADLEDDPPADPEWARLQQKMPPGLRPTPDCPPEDRSTFAAFRKSLACRFGFAFPESELHNQFEVLGDGVGAPTAPNWVMRAIGQGQAYRKDYSNIRGPVLALLEFPRWPDYMPKDELERALIDQFVARTRVIVGRWTGKLTRVVPDAKLVDLPGAGHYVFMTKEADVLREIHSFVAGLQRTSAK